VAILLTKNPRRLSYLQNLILITVKSLFSKDFLNKINRKAQELLFLLLFANISTQTTEQKTKNKKSSTHEE
jgi:hypothetical protein